MRMTIQVTGLKDLNAKLKEFGPRVYKRVMGTALKAAAVPILETARSLVPEDTGLLRESLTSVIRKYDNTNTVVAVLGPDRKVQAVLPDGSRHIPANVAHLVEYGHRIIPRGKGVESRAIRGAASKLARRGKRGRAEAVMGGLDALSGGRSVPAHPFMRPALDTQKGAVAAIMREKMRAGIHREMKRGSIAIGAMK